MSKTTKKAPRYIKTKMDWAIDAMATVELLADVKRLPRQAENMVLDLRRRLWMTLPESWRQGQVGEVLRNITQETKDELARDYSL